ncbi:MAG TPA: hypothetical protein VK488_03800 [Gaiellaceae bacterium]|nr:hypothetical protein [Gaiellaceae bacterium]
MSDLLISEAEARAEFAARIAHDALVAEHGTPADEGGQEVPEVLQPLWWAMAAYMEVPDPDVIVAALATAVAQAVPGDPLWLMIVHPSSSGKSEVIRLLDQVADQRVKEITLPGLLSITQSKNPKAIGLLTNYIGADALFTISDLSPMLGDTRQSAAAKSDLWNALRDIYDGEYRRTMHGGSVAWNGRLTMLAACTPEIDRYSAYADALGTRWLYYRPTATTAQARRDKTRFVLRRSQLNEHRASACAIATDLIVAARMHRSNELPESFEEPLAAAADLAAYGRAAVPRGWNREVDGIVTAEEPMRLAGQLRMLALGALALGIGEAMAMRVVHRAALSSMPQARRYVLEVLAGAEDGMSGRAVARAADLHQAVAARALEDWALVGFAEQLPINDDGDPAPGAVWSLTAENRELVRAVTEHAADIAPPNTPLLNSPSSEGNVRGVFS